MHDKKAIIAAFELAGIQGGDNVLLHSSYRSLGAVEGGPPCVLDALLEIIGPGGNLMLPAFNYTSPPPEPYFDPDITPSRTGVLCEVARSRGRRSLHPSHSVSVIGPDAEVLTTGHLAAGAFGLGSPIDLMAQRGGKIILLGVGHVANSTIHVGEGYSGIPKTFDHLAARPPLKIKMPTGEIIEHQLDRSISCSAAFGRMESALREHDKIRDTRLGACLIQCLPGAAVIARTCELLHRNPEALLCRNPQCVPCRGTEANIRRQPPSLVSGVSDPLKP